MFQIELPDVPEWPRPEMVRVPPGKVRMGMLELTELYRHEVRIEHSFALGKCPVTFAEWDAALAAGAKLPKEGAFDIGGWGRGRRPVICVSWFDAQAYLAWLNDKVGLTGRPDAYRLPSEAEWEYACRAGSKSKWWFGNDEAKLGDHAWFLGNSGRKTQPVGEKLANPSVFTTCTGTWRSGARTACSSTISVTA
jgi:formylglycine-generating enzyme required for sulfatase activity